MANYKLIKQANGQIRVFVAEVVRQWHRGNSPHYLISLILLLTGYKSSGEFMINGVGCLESGIAGSSIPPMHFHLVLESRKSTYRISAKAMDGEWYNNQVTSSDGIDNYFLDQRWPSWQARKNGADYTESGTVTDGVYPLKSLTLVQLMWLAYCSAGSFRGETNHLIIPLHSAKYSSSVGMTEIVSYRNSMSRFVENIQCFAQGLLISSRLKTIKLKPPFNQGFLLWEFHVTDFTNLGQVAMPLAFEFQQFYPNLKTGTNCFDTTCIYKAAFRADTVAQAVSSGSLMPMTTLIDVPVSDWRFHLTTSGTDVRGSSFVSYQISKGEWKRRDDKMASEQAFEIKQDLHMRRPAQSRPFVKLLVYIALTASFAFLCVLIIKQIKQTN